MTQSGGPANFLQGRGEGGSDDSQGFKLSAKEVSRVSRRVLGEVVVAINLERGTDLVDSDCADLSSHQIFIELLKVHFLSTTR